MNKHQLESRIVVAMMGAASLYGSYWSITHRHPVLFIALFAFGACCIVAAFEDVS